MEGGRGPCLLLFRSMSPCPRSASHINTHDGRRRCLGFPSSDSCSSVPRRIKGRRDSLGKSFTLFFSRRRFHTGKGNEAAGNGFRKRRRDGPVSEYFTRCWYGMGIRRVFDCTRFYLVKTFTEERNVGRIKKKEGKVNQARKDKTGKRKEEKKERRGE